MPLRPGTRDRAETGQEHQSEQRLIDRKQHRIAAQRIAAARAIDRVPGLRPHIEAERAQRERRDKPVEAVRRATPRNRQHVRMRLRELREERAGRTEETLRDADAGEEHRAEHEDIFDDAGPGRAAQTGAEDEQREHDKADADRRGRVIRTVARDAQENLQTAELQRDIRHDHDELQHRDPTPSARLR